MTHGQPRRPAGGGDADRRRQPSSRERGQGSVRIPDSWDGPRLASSAAHPRVAPPPAGWPASTVALAALALVAVSVAAGMYAWNMTSTPPAGSGAPPVPPAEGTAKPKPSRRAATRPTPTAAAPSTRQTASAAVRQTTAASSAPAASESPSRVPATPSACMHALMLPDAFPDESVDLSYVCGDRRAYRGTIRLKSDIVRAAGGGSRVTEAMREWSQLAWFEMAAFAAMRARCCPGAAALQAPEVVAGCRLEEALAYVANGIDDDKKMDAAAREAERSFQCIARGGLGEIFDRYVPPYGGERQLFLKLAERVRAMR